jgi:hypothetical protein
MLFKKAQGALEYLLLIGGAVLIAVIVIALLVGMGGQSRDTAQNQATQAQQALEQPQPASIVNIISDDCNASSGIAKFTLDWQALGEGGTHRFSLEDYQKNDLSLSKTGDLIDGLADNITEKLPITSTSESIYVNIESNNCEDTFWGSIETEKNGQFVNSTQRKVNFEVTAN